MAFDTGNFLVICGDGTQGGNFFIHERKDNAGKPGEIVTMADGKGDVNEVAKSYINDGFDPKKVIINGQLASDVFEKSDAGDKKVDNNEKAKQLASAYLTLQNPGLMMLLFPEQVKELIENRKNPIQINKSDTVA